MYNLGCLESEQGDTYLARDWYTRTIDSGHPEEAPRAMCGLGHLEAAQGKTDQARHWYAQAANSDQPDSASYAQRALRVMDQHEEEYRRAQEAIRRGY
jgi:TPR repeat protein